MNGRKLLVEVYVRDQSPDANLAHNAGIALQELGRALADEGTWDKPVVSSCPVFEASTATVLHYEEKRGSFFWFWFECRVWRLGVWLRHFRAYLKKLYREELRG